MRKLKNSFIKKSFESEGYKLLSTYVNAKKKLNYFCPEGHNHSVSWDNWNSKNTRCPYCAGNARLSLEIIRQEFEDEGYILLTEHYKNNTQKLNFICPNGHSHHISCGKWFSGYRCRKCYNKKQSIFMCGSGNYQWLGGKSYEPYCSLWKDSEFREFILERDNFKCLNPTCSGSSNRLNIHHIDYNKKNCMLNNLITLCVSCNAKANFDREWYESWYKAILFRRYNY
jgi:hypothetical protein